MGRRFLGSMVLVIALGLLLSGCGGKDPHLQRYSSGKSIQTCRIAILPFINKSAYDQGDKILYRILLSQLVIAQRWDVALEGDMNDLYRQLHIRPWHHPTPEQLQIIASRLNADILIGAEVLQMQEAIEGNYVNPRIEVQLNVYRGDTGTRLWSTYHKKQGLDYRKVMHFGLNNSVSQLGTTIIKEILSLWKDEALLHCQN